MNDEAPSKLTLINVLAAMLIVGFLALLLLPAINSTPVSGRRTTCLNNQKQLAAALLIYEGRHNQFPGYRNVLLTDALTAVDAEGFATGGAPLTISAPRPCTWQFMLLPDLEGNAILEAFGAKAPAGSAYRGTAPDLSNKLFLCPSDMQAEGNRAGGRRSANSYVANCGQPDAGGAGLLARRQRAEAGESTDFAPNGIFFDHYPYALDDLYAGPAEAVQFQNFQKVTVSSSTLTQGDGASSTIMISENSDCGRWTDAGAQAESAVGMVWWPDVDAAGVPTPPTLTINGVEVPVPLVNRGLAFSDLAVSGEDTYRQRYLFARPSSYHPDGVVVTFCDGRVEFISEDIDYVVFCLLMTPDGKRAKRADDPSLPLAPIFTDRELTEDDYGSSN